MSNYLDEDPRYAEAYARVLRSRGEGNTRRAQDVAMAADHQLVELAALAADPDLMVTAIQVLAIVRNFARRAGDDATASRLQQLLEELRPKEGRIPKREAATKGWLVAAYRFLVAGNVNGKRARAEVAAVAKTLGLAAEPEDVAKWQAAALAGRLAPDTLDYLEGALADAWGDSPPEGSDGMIRGVSAADWGRLVLKRLLDGTLPERPMTPTMPAPKPDLGAFRGSKLTGHVAPTHGA